MPSARLADRVASVVAQRPRRAARASAETTAVRWSTRAEVALSTRVIAPDSGPMTRRESAEPFVLSPLTLDWTIGELLAWIGAEDARCHDEGLAELLDAVLSALRPGSPRAAGSPSSTVSLVREVAVRVSEEPAVGRRRLAELTVAAVHRRGDRESSAPLAVASVATIVAAAQPLMARAVPAIPAPAVPAL